MKTSERLLDACIRAMHGAIGLAGGRHAGAIRARIAERIVPTVDCRVPAGTVRFYCPDPLPEQRARTFLTKEPETLAWIDGFERGDVLWDIGANVGSFSLYAALKQVRAIAFEPSAGNYYLLNRNIEINGMSDRITALCVALSDDTRLASFHMQTTQLGGALSSFSEAVDWQGRSYTAAFEQGMIGFDIDSFIEQFEPPFPAHIKIDVDGREDKVIAGASRTLRDPRLKSLLVELDGAREAYTADVIRQLDDAGLALDQKGQSLRIGGGEAHYYLYIFRRRT